jgi:hypothetical protein
VTSWGGVKENKMVWMEILLLIIGAIAGGVIVYLREYFILKHEYKLKTANVGHEYKLKTINARIEEFIDDSKKYFGPIGLASSDLSSILKAHKNEILKQKEIPFYWLAKYLYQRDLLKGNTYFHFPCEAEEKKVGDTFNSLNTIIAEMFDYNKRYIANIVNYYESYNGYNAFCDNLPAVTVEFTIFKNKINNNVFKSKLCEKSEDFSNSVIGAITTAYEPWYEQHDKYKQ